MEERTSLAGRTYIQKYMKWDGSQKESSQIGN